MERRKRKVKERGWKMSMECDERVGKKGKEIKKVGRGEDD